LRVTGHGVLELKIFIDTLNPAVENAPIDGIVELLDGTNREIAVLRGRQTFLKRAQFPDLGPVVSAIELPVTGAPYRLRFADGRTRDIGGPSTDL
jgi:hypothetical protein